MPLGHQKSILEYRSDLNFEKAKKKTVKKVFMEINEKIFEQIVVLKERPRMLLTCKTIDYEKLKCYVDGYLDGLSHAYDKPLTRNITRWFEKKEKIHPRLDVFWLYYLPFYYKEKTDDELKEILLDNLEQYFIEKPAWYRE